MTAAGSFRPTGPDEASRDAELTVDRRFKLLKNSRRRRILEYLDEHGGPTTRSELAETIAAAENGVRVEELDSSQRKRVYVSLYQTHLPTLARADVIEYDGDRGTVAPAKNMAELLRYVRDEPSVSDGRTGTDGQYVAVSLVGAATLLVVRVASPGASPLLDLWAGAFVSALLLLAVLRRWRGTNGGLDLGSRPGRGERTHEGGVRPSLSPVRAEVGNRDEPDDGSEIRASS